MAKQKEGREGNEGEIYFKSGKLPFLLTFDYFLNMIIMSEIIWTIRIAYIKIFHTHYILIFYGRQIYIV